jgi:hypothetical protein
LRRWAELALRTGATPVVLAARAIARALDDESDWAAAGLPRRSPLLAAKLALDEIFFATEIATAVVVSLGQHRRLASEIVQALELYEARGWIADPASFHREPTPLASERLDDVQGLFGRYLHLRAESGYEPHAEEPGRERWLGYRPNRTAHAWLLEHAGAPRPWLVCLPGYRMGHPAVDFVGFGARWLHRTLGLNVAIPVMPFHGPRRVGWRGGDGFLTGDFLDTVHAQAQAVWDARRLVGWLRARGAPAVGAYGVSLGAYTAGLLAGLDAELDCVIAGIPAADFLRLLRSHVPEFLIQGALRHGFPFDRIERLLTVISPLAIPPRVARERRYLYAGLGDRLAHPEHARELWRHWGEPRLDWYSGGHVSFLFERRAHELVRDALAASGLTR